MEDEKIKVSRVSKTGINRVENPHVGTRRREGGGRSSSPLFELNGLPAKATGEPGYFRADLNRTTSAERFSIVREFYEKCDLESRLILIDAIPEVGESKELAFLRSLTEDEIPEIRAKALESCNILENRLRNQTGGLLCGEPVGSEESPEMPAGTRSYGSRFANFTPDFKNIREIPASG
ncbi:hypothetical protein [Robiginitalea sp. SC105]|uniref:hypothetical protein n=1 Tax=Robiginitalea sp. SC105 TaxID=2762332 RepID=UPI00163B50D6|nr:hypothetical protein [Robiginitalea sp. SC105]MBC2840580.1 hypothetical protein [Robiginitalea sp. SC105]